MRTMLKSKIQDIRVADMDLNYESSITISRDLMKEADILPYEQVHVLNVNNGARFITYAIEGDEGDVCVNGAAVRLVQIGDELLILTYVDLTEEEIKTHKPIIV